MKTSFYCAQNTVSWLYAPKMYIYAEVYTIIMTKLSVNINKVATIRNARGGNLPDLVQFAKDCEAFGAQGITVHPRPDERHIRYADVPAVAEIVTTEYNIEGYPSEKFMELVLKTRPHQCTLVPDPPGILTSDSGWDTLARAEELTPVIERLKAAGIRVSIFLNPIPEMVDGAKAVGTDRIELYTGDYAKNYHKDRAAAVAPHQATALRAQELGIGLNAGHDLNLENLRYYQQQVPDLLEVSIGHALICDALYLGVERTIERYLEELSGS